MARRDEQAVIGSILIDSACLPDVDKADLRAEDFEDATFRLAFEVIEDFRQSDKIIDPILVSDEMTVRQGGDYQEILHDALVYTHDATNAGAYAAQVKDWSKRKRFLDALSDATTVAAYGDWRSEMDAIFDLLRDLKGAENGLTTGAVLTEEWLDYFETVKRDPKAAFCETGFADLDRQFGGGMFKSEVYIIGARPGMGKTTLGINIAQNIVNRGGAVYEITVL